MIIKILYFPATPFRHFIPKSNFQILPKEAVFDANIITFHHN